MFAQGLTWDANLSAFSMWVAAGFLISVVDIKLPGAIKGLLVSFLVALPVLILIGRKEPVTLIPICIMILLLGSLLGFAIEKVGRRISKLQINAN
jgi:hypothetical protein